jgi:chitin synthase
MNMYLAEDRIMCLELYACKQKRYYQKYIPNSDVRVDPVKNIPTLLAQRRRWNNGGWFALKYVFKHYTRVHESSHTFIEKIGFYSSLGYAYVMRYMAYYSIAIFFVVQLTIIKAFF